MGCCVQLVMGPAGSGKSTYCQVMQEHCANLGRIRGRSIHVANLDPAAETFKYDVAFDPEMKTPQVRRSILSELAPQSDKRDDDEDEALPLGVDTVECAGVVLAPGRRALPLATMGRQAMDLRVC